MNELTGIIILAIVINFGTVLLLRMTIEGINQAREKEREQWREERQQLLDRIQAPSFDHLKHHEVKVIKAQNGAKEPPPLEQL
ncbi:hypothetical protein AB6A23_11145 [Paenibacillus tarimensis]